MRTITLQTLDKSSSFTLGDDSAGVWISNYSVVPSFTTHVVPGTRSVAVKIWPRYNVSREITFTVQRAYDDANAAWTAYHDHPDELPVQGILTVNQDGILRSYLDATKTKIEPTWRGEVGIDWTYHFIASQCFDATGANAADVENV